MRTIAPQEMAKYRETARRRRIAAEQQRLQRLERGWAVARKAAQILSRQFGAQSVLVFGSLVNPERFHLGSDADLAVSGVKERDYLRAVAAVTGLDQEISVDLIVLEEAPPSLRDTILSEGKEL